MIYPKLYLGSVKEITVEILKEHNIKGLIMDVDNTLIDFDKNIPDGIEEWVTKMKNAGISFYILSNTNHKEKVENVSKELDIPYINFAKKPLKGGFNKVKEKMRITT